MGDSKGFTLIEVLVALFIMSIGFLALSQMQYLSFRQTQLAHSGTTATNLIQAFSDSDLSRLRSIHLNNRLIINKADDRLLTSEDIEFCNNDLCDNLCPCDPFLLISDPVANQPEIECAVIDFENFRLEEPIFSSDRETCINQDGINKSFYLLRTVDLDTNINIFPTERTYSITYSIIFPGEFEDPNIEELSDIRPGNTIASQQIELTAHVLNIGFNDPGLNAIQFVIPHIP